MITISSGTESVSITRYASQSSSFSRGLSSLSSMLTAGGCHLGARSGRLFNRGSLIVDTVSESDAILVRDFLFRVIRFGTGYFTLLSDKSDLGEGVGNPIPECYLDGQSSTGVYIYRVGTYNKFSVKIDYFYWSGVAGGHGTR